jgi:hypothetical protein
MAAVRSAHNLHISAHYARWAVAGKLKVNVLGHFMRSALTVVWGV